MTTEDIEETYKLYKDWVINEDDLIGTDVQIGKRIRAGCPNVDSFALTEVFDRKVDSKAYIFFDRR